MQMERLMKTSEEGSPFLLGILGCTTRTDPTCVLLEYAEHGDLLSYLLHIRNEVSSKEESLYAYHDVSRILHSWLTHHLQKQRGHRMW